MIPSTSISILCIVLISLSCCCHAFTTTSLSSSRSVITTPSQQQPSYDHNHHRRQQQQRLGRRHTHNNNNNVRINNRQTVLRMGLDMVTYLRCEWVSAALCTNQTPRSANVCLILGVEDGRPVTFIPRTIETLITSTVEPDGILPVSVERQLKQQEKNRGSAMVNIVNQRADDLKETSDESVDVVISLQSAARMIETGLDWKKSVQEAARVLKPGGRFLFVEQTTLEDQNYLEYVGSLGIPESVAENDGDGSDDEDDSDEEEEYYPTFECIGYDDVDLVLTPHVAGVFVKSEDAGLSAAERSAKEKKIEEERMAEASIAAYERGRKRKRKKKKGAETENA